MTAEERAQVEQEVRRECAQIAALEYGYWRDHEESSEQLGAAISHHMGAMGAAANICAAILGGRTLAQVREDIKGRDKHGHQ